MSDVKDRRAEAHHTVSPDEAARRRIERWALVAGVTGCTANALLLALWTVALPGNHDYDWTGPANDVVGAVSAMAMIPMAIGVRDVLGRPGHLPLATQALIVGNCALTGASALLVLGLIRFEVQAVVAIPAIAAQFAWLGSAGRWGRRTGRLTRRLSRVAEISGAAVLVSLPLAAVAALAPARSPVQYLVGGVAATLGLSAFVAFPFWQIALSRHLSRR